MNTLTKLSNLIAYEKAMYADTHAGKIDILDIIFSRIHKNSHAVQEAYTKGISFTYRPNTFDLHVLNEVIVHDCYLLENLLNNQIQTIIDIGAYIGDFTLFSHSLFPSASIYAFEPVKENYDLLKQNCKKVKNIKVYKLAVSSQEVLHMHLDESNSGGHTPGNDGIEVQTISFKHIFVDNNIKSCDVLKVDCEGGEYELFLQKENEPYLQKTKIVTMEYHITKGYGPKDRQRLLRRLKELGFVYKEAKTQNEIGMQNMDTGMLYAYNQAFFKTSPFRS